MGLNSANKEEVVVVVGDPLEAAALPFIKEIYDVKSYCLILY